MRDITFQKSTSLTPIYKFIKLIDFRIIYDCQSHFIGKTSYSAFILRPRRHEAIEYVEFYCIFYVFIQFNYVMIYNNDKRCRYNINLLKTIYIY